MRTILLADDEPNLRILVRTTLEDPEHRIVEAANGPDALALIRSERPDLVILDWMMPGMSGVEVIEAVRADPSNDGLPVIMLTAKGQEQDRSQAQAAGCSAFLVKPFSPLELLGAVQRALSASQDKSTAPETEVPELTPEMLARLEQADRQLALYARDLKRAFDLERSRARELAEANARLESLGRLKSEFLSLISHELRTPLNAMSALDLYDPAADPRDQAEVIELVRHGYDRLREFIERALEYLNWSATDPATSADVVDLAQVLDRVAASLHDLQAPGVRFEVRGGAGPCLVRARAMDLATVAKVLLENALKFSPEKKQVQVDLRSRGDVVTLSVADRGVGIKKEMLREIFRPLTSGDITHRTSGSGLSLALGHAIVKAYGGRVSARSAGPGQGATFTVELPSAAIRPQA